VQVRSLVAFVTMAPQTRLTTRFCQRLGVLAPVVLAPMGGCAGGRLAAAVAAAGGVGFVGSGGESLAYLRSEWAMAVSQPGVPRQNLGFGMNINQLEELPAGTLEALLEELQPAHLFLSFGSLAPHAQAAREAGVHLYSNAGDTATALAHARDGATCVVMQGSDAGGHTGDKASVFSLVPQARHHR
jgi:nitronate monooxygenase